VAIPLSLALIHALWVVLVSIPLNPLVTRTIHGSHAAASATIGYLCIMLLVGYAALSASSSRDRVPLVPLISLTFGTGAGLTGVALF